MSDDPTKDCETPDDKDRFGLLGQLADCFQRMYGLSFHSALTYVTATHAQLAGPDLQIMLPGGQTIPVTGQMLVLADNPGGRFWHRCREHLLRPVVREVGKAMDTKTCQVPQTLQINYDRAKCDMDASNAELEKLNQQEGAKLQGLDGLSQEKKVIQFEWKEAEYKIRNENWAKKKMFARRSLEMTPLVVAHRFTPRVLDQWHSLSPDPGLLLLTEASSLFPQLSRSGDMQEEMLAAVVDTHPEHIYLGKGATSAAINVSTQMTAEATELINPPFPLMRQALGTLSCPVLAPPSPPKYEPQDFHEKGPNVHDSMLTSQLWHRMLNRTQTLQMKPETGRYWTALESDCHQRAAAAGQPILAANLRALPYTALRCAAVLSLYHGESLITHQMLVDFGGFLKQCHQDLAVWLSTAACRENPAASSEGLRKLMAIAVTKSRWTERQLYRRMGITKGDLIPLIEEGVKKGRFCREGKEVVVIHATV
jgi:hypothetical protein